MIPQVKNLKTAEDFLAHLTSLGIDLPFLADADGAGTEPLAAPVTIGGRTDRELVAPNRFAILPMEGWDGDTEGRPTELVQRRWQRFGSSGAGLVWAEATAVSPEGRANPNQLVLNSDTVGEFAKLRGLLDPGQVCGLQLTHSGRWSRPDIPRPRTAYRHPQLDTLAGDEDAALLSDGELDDLVTAYVAAAHLVSEAGFDFVDVKACHGYLLHELLTAHDRPGRYGGDLAGRSRFLTSVIGEIRQQLPEMVIAVRMSIFDFAPHEPGDGGVGRPSTAEPYRYAFGGNSAGTGIDLAETHELLRVLTDAGVRLVSATAGSPYYCPHVQRPAFFPPSDGYKPPEDPLVGVARLLSATAEVTNAHPLLTVVGTGYSYLQEWLPAVARGVVADNGASMIGLGRMALSMPDLPTRVLGGAELERRLLCRTFSDCTTAPRAGLISGCFPLDDFYKERPERVTLSAAKREARARLR